MKVSEQLFIIDQLLCTYLARVTFVLLYGGVRDEPHVVVHVEMEERAGFASGLGDDQIVERIVLEEKRKKERNMREGRDRMKQGKRKRKEGCQSQVEKQRKNTKPSNNSTTCKNQEYLARYGMLDAIFATYKRLFLCIYWYLHVV